MSFWQITKFQLVQPNAARVSYIPSVYVDVCRLKFLRKCTIISHQKVAHKGPDFCSVATELAARMRFFFLVGRLLGGAPENLIRARRNVENVYSNKPYEPNMISRNIIYMISHCAISPRQLYYAARHNKGVKRPGYIQPNLSRPPAHSRYSRLCTPRSTGYMT